MAKERQSRVGGFSAQNEFAQFMRKGWDGDMLAPAKVCASGQIAPAAALCWPSTYHPARPSIHDTLDKETQLPAPVSWKAPALVVIDAVILMVQSRKRCNTTGRTCQRLRAGIPGHELDRERRYTGGRCVPANGVK
jgi:hypothetical protein